MVWPIPIFWSVPSGQTKILVLPRPNRQKNGIGQTEQTEEWYWPDRTDQNIGLGQTEQTKVWVLARPNRQTYGYWTDGTDRNRGISKT